MSHSLKLYASSEHLPFQLIREVAQHTPALGEVLVRVANQFKASLPADKQILIHGRLERGLELARNGSVQVMTGGSPRQYRVRSSDRSHYYEVDLQAHTCTCPDSQKGHTCKHRIAAYFIEQAYGQLLSGESQKAIPVSNAASSTPIPPIQEPKVTPTCSIPPLKTTIIPDQGADGTLLPRSDLNPMLGTLYRRYLHGADLDQAYTVKIEAIQPEIVHPHPSSSPMEKWSLLVSGLPQGLPNRILFGAKAEEDLVRIFGKVRLDVLRGQRVVVYPSPIQVAGLAKVAIRFRRAV